jgi:hypothetical protein
MHVMCEITSRLMMVLFVNGEPNGEKATFFITAFLSSSKYDLKCTAGDCSLHTYDLDQYDSFGRIIPLAIRRNSNSTLPLDPAVLMVTILNIM